MKNEEELQSEEQELTTVNVLPQLEIDLDLPDITNDVIKAHDAIDGVILKFVNIKTNNLMSNYWHNKLYEDNSRVLNYLAALSQPIFDVEDRLEETYTRRYLSDPTGAKHAWYQHYDKLHQPITVLKNKCWRLYDMLDKEYQYKFPDKNPPNWDKRLYEKISSLEMIFDDQQEDFSDVDDYTPQKFTLSKYSQNEHNPEFDIEIDLNIEY